MGTRTHMHIQTRTWIMKHIHPCTFLCCTVHNKSCFIKAKSHPLSVYNHRSRLNRRGNTIPFRFGVILIYELVSATLVCGYEPGKHPQHCNIAPAHSQDRLVHTKQLAAHIHVRNCVSLCVYVHDSAPMSGSFSPLISTSGVISKQLIVNCSLFVHVP